jgi:tRNA nucleotidyltransferase/poly(A) polymerase
MKMKKKQERIQNELEKTILSKNENKIFYEQKKAGFFKSN